MGTTTLLDVDPWRTADAAERAEHTARAAGEAAIAALCAAGQSDIGGYLRDSFVREWAVRLKRLGFDDLEGRAQLDKLNASGLGGGPLEHREVRRIVEGVWADAD